ncbi:MAG TPA: PD-(D/E)XK nuclease family transposase, partial [Candidatus Avimuribaculum pullicola]|nr:PD-(D/E)XK nuclease family transposase [Candidatus Avimuribaculum pullicola]
QNNRELSYFHRMLYGVSKTVSEYINLGEDYDKVRKVYSINIVYFELGQGKDYVYHGRNEFRGIHDGDLLQLSRRQQEIFKCKYASDIFPEYYVLKVNDFNKVAKTPLDEWMCFLKTGRIEATATAQGLPEARERLRVDSMPEAERRAYIRGVEAEVYQRSVLFSSWDDGRQEGLKEGKKEGKKEATIEMARNLKQLGVPIETIIKSSGLTEAEIAQL